MGAKDYDSRTPLHIASAYGSLESVNYLLSVAGVSPNPVDRWGATPLNNAASKVVQTLTANGAINSTNQP